MYLSDGNPKSIDASRRPDPINESRIEATAYVSNVER